MFQTGNPFFPPWNKELKQVDVIRMIKSDIDMFFLAVESQLLISDFRNTSFFTPIVLDAQANVLRSIAVVEKIVGEDITQKGLQDFPQTVKLYMIAGGVCHKLAGLSSLDGSRQYISERVLQQSGFIAFQRTMEHEYMHNISRWKYPKDHCRISPAKNANLRSKGTDDMIEAGHYYEEWVWRKAFQNPSPFCLNLILDQE
jgi:hypothetical protein